LVEACFLFLPWLVLLLLAKEIARASTSKVAGGRGRGRGAAGSGPSRRDGGTTAVVEAGAGERRPLFFSLLVRLLCWLLQTHLSIQDNARKWPKRFCLLAHKTTATVCVDSPPPKYPRQRCRLLLGREAWSDGLCHHTRHVLSSHGCRHTRPIPLLFLLACACVFPAFVFVFTRHLDTPPRLLAAPRSTCLGGLMDILFSWCASPSSHCSLPLSCSWFWSVSAWHDHATHGLCLALVPA
jgi:hypothetical protein